MATRISKRDFVSPRTAYRGGAVLMGLPFVAVGSYFALVGGGLLPVPGKANAPLWVVGCVGLAFALAGAMLVCNGIRGLWNQRRARALRAAANEPWFRDYAWETHGTRDRALGRVGNSLAGLLLMAALLAPFNWWAFLSPHRPLMVQVITGVFDFVLLLVAGTLLYQLGQFLKYGHSSLRFETFPFFLGEHLQVAFSPNRFERLRFTLRFVEERFEQRGTGENRSVQLVNYAHFEEVKTLDVRPTDAEVPVTFDLPDNPEWTNALSGQPARYWELLVEARTPGIDFKTTFPLPVYAREGELAACTP